MSEAREARSLDRLVRLRLFRQQHQPKESQNMKVVTTGHKYELDHFESYGLPGCPVQTLQFIEKVPSADNPKELVTVNDGTTDEEVLKVLIDRLQYLNGKFPCRENAIVITKLEASLMWLNKRTSDRLARNVEGKAAA